MKNNNDKNSPLKYNGPSALSPNYTGLNLQFGNEFPSIYGGGAGLNSNYSGLNLGGSSGTFGGSATNLIGSAGGALNKVIDAGNTSASAAGGGGFGQRLQSNAAIAGMASGFGGIIQGLVGRGARQDAQIKAQDEYDRMLSDYKNLDTSNLYANVQNKYANLENTMEDLTVNQQQAQFQAQQGAQSRANIMQGLRGAAGSSGIAGLAQAMANQGQLQNQQASASIGMQESRNQLASAQMAAKIQQIERGGEAQAQAMRLAGAEKARSLEYQQTGTMLGMSQQRLASANNAIAAADAALYGGIGSLVGVGASAALGGIGGS